MSRIPNRNFTTRLLFSLGVLVVVTLALGAARAQWVPPHPPAHFVGLVNDFTPSSVKNGPYVMSAKWTLNIRPTFNGDVAEFTADMNMETSDYGVNEGIVDPTNTVNPRRPHPQHHPHQHQHRLQLQHLPCQPSGNPGGVRPEHHDYRKRQRHRQWISSSL